MMRALVLALSLSAIASAPLAAQGSDPDRKVAGGGALPAGWQLRLDRANANAADAKVVKAGNGYQITTGPSGVFYNAAETATGSYGVEATFTQLKAPTHPEAYGIVFGGKNLDKPTQEYFYFIVRGDGKYMVKHRANDTEVHTIKDWTAHEAIKAQDASGKATNALAVVVGPQTVSYRVNGTEVFAQDLAGVSGMVGLRVNHNLDVQVDRFSVSKGGK